MTYNIKFDVNNIDCDKIPLNLATLITKSVSNDRINEYASFASYGHLTFAEDDTKHKCPIVNEEQYNRLHTNCIIYDLKENENNDTYDKCFIYHTNGKKIGNYGFVLLNTETNKQFHKYFIDDTTSDLIISLYNTITSIARNNELVERLKNSLNMTK